MALQIQISDQDLPVLSAIASQALQMIQDPNVTNKQIDELIRQDIGLTERLMRTANSPFYGGRVQTTTISDAIFRLGMRQLRNVLVAAATGEFFSETDPVAQALWHHGLATAMAAQLLADHFEIAHKEEAFIAGMLHDVGILIIYRQHPAEYSELLLQARAAGRPLHEIELEQLQYFTHMSVGGLAIRKWRLADAAAEAARFHHDLESDIPGAVQFRHLACVVAVADLLVTQLAQDPARLDWDRFSSMACTRFLNLSRARLEPLLPRFLEQLTSQRDSARV